MSSKLELLDGSGCKSKKTFLKLRSIMTVFILYRSYLTFATSPILYDTYITFSTIHSQQYCNLNYYSICVNNLRGFCNSLATGLQSA